MNRLLEEYGREQARETKIQIATRMLKRGTYTLEEIAEYVDLPLDRVEELARKVKEE